MRHGFMQPCRPAFMRRRRPHSYDTMPRVILWETFLIGCGQERGERASTRSRRRVLPAERNSRAPCPGETCRLAPQDRKCRGAHAAALRNWRLPICRKKPGIVAQKRRSLCPRKPFRYNERIFSKFGRKLFQQKGIRMKPQNDQHADVRSCIERHFLRFANSTDKAPLYILSLFVDRKIRRPSAQVDQVVVFEGLQIKVGVRHV